jgi:sec-independent protein translocase protein TatB
VFDISWSELFVIAVVAVIFIGPKELPQVMRSLGRIARRLQYMKFALMTQVDAVMREADLDELRRGVNMRVMADEDTDERAADEMDVIDLKPERENARAEGEAGGDAAPPRKADTP